MEGPAYSVSPLSGSPVKVTVTAPCAAGSATVWVAGTETVCAAAGTARPKSSRSARKPRHGHRMACRTSATARTKAGSRLLEGEAEGPALKRRPAGAEGSGGEEERPRPRSHGDERRAARLGSARLGSARLGSARLGSARLGSARLGSARLGSARLGSARLGSARLTMIPASIPGRIVNCASSPTLLDMFGSSSALSQREHVFGGQGYHGLSPSVCRAGS